MLFALNIVKAGKEAENNPCRYVRHGLFIRLTGITAPLI